MQNPIPLTRALMDEAKDDLSGAYLVGGVLLGIRIGVGHPELADMLHDETLAFGAQENMDGFAIEVERIISMLDGLIDKEN